MNTKLINIDIWRNPFDLEYRVKVMFLKWKIAMFRIKRGDIESEYITKIERVNN